MKNILSLFLIAGSLFTGASEMYGNISEPYASVADLPFDSHGWFGNAEQLSACLQEKPVSAIIEVGSWLGCSTRFFASSVDAGVKVYAVDTWGGSPEEAVHMQDPRLPYLYQLFLSNVKHAGLTETIVPVRMTSLEAAKALNVKADLIYLDAAHDTANVYADIHAWYPHLNEGGILCGDDWLWPTVREAVVQAAQELNKSIYVSENFWRYY